MLILNLKLPPLNKKKNGGRLLIVILVCEYNLDKWDTWLKIFFEFIGRIIVDLTLTMKHGC